MIRIIAEIDGRDKDFQRIARRFEDILSKGNMSSKPPHEYLFRAELVQGHIVVSEGGQ